MARIQGASANLSAFLDMIAFSEIGPALLAMSDDGYNVCVGSTPAKPILFASYDSHPRIRCEAQNSDAAGRYQFMGRYWDAYKRQLALPDFGPVSQDRWCIQLIRECRAVGLVEAGRIREAITACKSRWASFPGANYAAAGGGVQNMHTPEALIGAYVRSGGVVAP